MLFTVSLASQANIFLVSVAGGMTAAFIYDLFRVRRRAIRTCDLFVHIEDLLYWILIAVLFFGLAYCSNDGEIRGYMFIGAIIGAVLYVFTLSKVVVMTLVTMVNFIVIVLKTAFRIIAYPFRALSGFFMRMLVKADRNIPRLAKK